MQGKIVKLSHYFIASPEPVRRLPPTKKSQLAKYVLVKERILAGLYTS